VSRLLLLLAGLGLARLFWRRPPHALHQPAAAPVLDPRAEALRAKLEESKAVVDEREEFEAAETPLDEADPDERRRRVHAAARATVEEMRGSGRGESLHDQIS
jgi:hypothetical protein